MNPDQTATTVAVCSGSTLFVKEAFKTFQQMTKQNICCVWCIKDMCGSRKFVRRGPNLTTIFYIVDEGRDDPHTIKSGPSSAC